MIEASSQPAPGPGRYDVEYSFTLEPAAPCLEQRIAEFFAARGANGLVIDKSEVRFSRGTTLGACLPGPRHRQEARIEVADMGELNAAVTCRFQGTSLVPARSRLRREVERLRLALES